jgi:predicted ABC-type ATPase
MREWLKSLSRQDRRKAGKKNFALLYRNLVDEWILYDNSGKSPRLIDSSARHE